MGNKKSRVENRTSKSKLNNKKKKKKKFSILSLILTCILIFVIYTCACFSYYFVKEEFDFSKALELTINKISFRAKPITVLILGVSTDLSSELADTIMICSYNPSNQYAYMLSIPRDTFIGDNIKSAKGRDKINAMYSRDGAKAMEEKIEYMTGIDIDYYAVVKNQTVIDVVDAIGGINFDVPINMDYDDITQDLHIHLKSGNQLIDGEKAEQLLRFRHNNDGTSYPSSYGDNDFGRMKTQREFIKETVKQTASLKNIFKFGKISRSIFKNIETDMGFFTIVKYIPSALSFDIESLQSEQLPGESKKCNAVWVYVHDENETKNLVNELKNKMN